MASPDTKASMMEDVWSYANKKGKQSINDGVKLDKWMTNGEKSGDMVGAIIDKAIDTNKKQYVEQRGQDLTQSLERGDMETAEATILDMRDNMNIPEDQIREQVSNYFRPLYYQAYADDDDETMDDIKDILYDFDIGYTKQTFSSWNSSAKKKYGDEEPEEEDEPDKEQWLR